jgi:NADP-dependent 3-hydroxy acid dehydrogenase YdfG
VKTPVTTESRTALITGASSGLGAAIALEMATRGWKLAIGARRTDRLAETAERVRAQGAAKVYAGDLDVADDASVERFFEASENAVGVADVIVNNAGASRFHWLEETDTRWLRSEIVITLRLGPALSEFALGWDLTPKTMQKRTEHWASFGLRDARMLAQGNLGILMPDDVARAVVHAVTQPRHVLHDTIELQPSVPRRVSR